MYSVTFSLLASSSTRLEKSKIVMWIILTFMFYIIVYYTLFLSYNTNEIVHVKLRLRAHVYYIISFFSSVECSIILIIIL